MNPLNWGAYSGGIGAAEGGLPQFRPKGRLNWGGTPSRSRELGRELGRNSCTAIITLLLALASGAAWGQGGVAWK